MFDLRVQVPKILLHFYRCYEGVVKKERELKKTSLASFLRKWLQWDLTSIRQGSSQAQRNFIFIQ